MKKVILCAALLMPMMANAQQFSNKALIGSARQSLENEYGKSYNNLSVVEDLEQMAVVSSASGGTAYVDKTTNKVLGFTPSSYAKGDVVPCGLELWIGAANNAIKKGMTRKGTTRSSSYTEVSPLVTTSWNQEKPYFNLCPKSGLKRCYTGCVATAMAQVMNYFEYPASGHGSSTYSVTSGSGSSSKTESNTGTINGVYDWENMIDSYSKSYTDEQATAVATLMRDCGYSVHMNYSKEGSAAYDLYEASALAYNFDYDSLSIYYLQRKYCTDEEWYGIVYSELEAQRPVLYAGQSASSKGGHAFVLDGVDSDGKVHINWGWGGVGDGYFDLSVMSSTNDYTLSQSMVYGFNPRPTPENSTKTYASRMHVYSPQVSAENGHIYLEGGIVNGDWRVFVGDVTLSVQDVNDEDNAYDLTIMVAPTEEESDALPGGYGWYFYDSEDNERIDFNSYFVDETTKQELVFPEGTYEMLVTYKSVNDEAEKTAVTDGGVEWRQKFSVDANGAITLDNTSGISSVVLDKTSSVDTSKAYDLNGNRVSSRYKGLKIVKGKKYVER